MISVGFVDANNQMGRRQPQVTQDLFFPGVDITCYAGDDEYSLLDGNSLAVSQAAGLGAYLMSLAEVVSELSLNDRSQDETLYQRVRTYMQGLAYSRSSGGPAVGWNGANLNDCGSSSGGSNNKARQENGVCAALSSSSKLNHKTQYLFS
jgi:hypothetical protein